MKNKIILIVIILTTVLITMIFCIINKKEVEPPLQSKTEIIKNLKIENENILKSDEAVIIKANIKNNNKVKKKIISNYTNQREYSEEFLNSLYANFNI